ncbi:MAG TPA: alkaline phosphatase family protein [Thermoanaerobaculia bacterium]|nr:alkaline phosphatase family protein [Thermoanaerobaculia bacterium]
MRSPRVLLVVIDALRVDAAQDGRLMPNLHRVAGGGASGAATVESWIPSTVAGIRALIEGAVPPPVSFLQDFGTGRAPSGGIFEALSLAGLRAFAAGPRLWSDLYGPWLAGSVSVDSMAGDDGRVLAAGLDALERGGYDLIVVHLGKPDAAAHLHGARSPEYREAVRRADAALGELMDRAGPGTTVIVTSDHGVTDQGGHAGPEQEVLEVPVALGGPDLLPSDFGEFPQKDLPRLVLSPFGLSLPAAPPEAPRRFRATAHLLFLLAVVAGMVICRALMAGAEGGRVATLLPAALWIGIVLAVLGLFRLALLIVLAALGFAAWKTAGPWRSRWRLSGFGRIEPEWIGALAALGFAWLLGSSRLFEPRFDDLSFARGFRPLAILFVASGLLRQVRIRKGREVWRAHPKGRILAAALVLGGGAWILGGPPLLGICAVAGLAGALLSSFLVTEVRPPDGPESLLAWALDRSALQLGFLCGFLPAFFSSLLGETASLSTLDVRFAFRIADGPLGLPGAVLAVLLPQALPTLALLLGLAPALARSHPGRTGEFAAGMALAVLGQGLAVGLSLTGFPFLGGRGSDAVGLLVRLVGEVTFLFLGSAAAVAFGRIRPPAARPGPPAATSP